MSLYEVYEHRWGRFWPVNNAIKSYIGVKNALLHGDHCHGSSNRHGDREVVVLQFCGIALSLACALRAVT